MDVLRKFLRSINWQVSAILAMSLGLRWVLILKGGQYFFPDEVRYLNSISVANAIAQGDFSKAIAELTISAINIGYRAIAVIPALAELYFPLPSRTPALFFSLFSVFNLYIIWKIAQRIGMTEREANIALFLAASSHSLLYFSRHLFPYDTALFFGLLAVYSGLNSNQKLILSIASGVLSFMCFVCYNGYWPLAALAIVFPPLIDIDKKRLFFRRVLLASTGFVLSLSLLALLMVIASSRSAFRDYIGLAQTISQGSYSEGWSLPFVYLWHSEHVIFLIVVLASLYVVFNFQQGNRKVLMLGIWGTVFIYLCLSIPSTGLQVFVVYGRLARQLIPFLTLSAAHGLSLLIEKESVAKRLYPVLILAILAQGAINYGGAYLVFYPREFIKMAQEQYPAFNISIKRTFTGAPPVCKFKNFIATNTKFFYPLPEPVPLIQGERLISVPHPMTYIPYQYEGNTPEDRRIFQMEKIKMELYQVDVNSNIALFEGIASCIATNPE